GAVAVAARGARGARRRARCGRGDAARAAPRPRARRAGAGAARRGARPARGGGCGRAAARRGGPAPVRVLRPARLLLVLAALAALLAAALAAALATGPSPLAPGAALRALFDPDAAGAAGDIVRRIRLPRALAAGLVGACLSVAGVLFQALLRNPLADPFVLGVSGGAALAGVAVLSLGGALGIGAGAVPLAAV